MNIIDEPAGFSKFDSNNEEEIELNEQVIIGMHSRKSNSNQKILHQMGAGNYHNDLINSY
jgi:hypothetical protein